MDRSGSPSPGETLPKAAGLESVPPSLRRAGAADVAPLAEALARAFHDDPAFVWLMPDERTRPRRLRRFFEIELREVGLARGDVWAAVELDGAAISTPPGKWRLPWYRFTALIPAYAETFGKRLPHAQSLLTRIESRHPSSAHHYFPVIGVVPERQGQGVGTALMNPTLERCDQEGLPAYLEASTERSAMLYARLGFESVEELEYGGTQPLRLMLRSPRPR